MAILSKEDAANSNAVARLGDEIPTREARVRATGETTLVDDRTFNPDVHAEMSEKLPDDEKKSGRRGKDADA